MLQPRCLRVSGRGSAQLRSSLRPGGGRSTPFASVQRRRLLACSTQQRAGGSSTSSSSNGATVEPPAAVADGQVPLAAPPPPNLECIGTGQEVECRIITEYPNQPPEIAAQEAAAAAAQSESHGPLSLLDALLLISPFFFWGTSMVAMKQLAPHTTPLLVASWRLIPAGAVLLLWAQRSGRKAPTDPQAWLVVALFGLVDGAAFQGFLAEGLQRTSAGLGSVIIDSQPLSVALLAALLFGEELGGGGVAGLFLGVAGLCLLELPPSVLAALPDSFAAGALQLAAGSSGGDAASAAAALGSDAASAAAAALGGGDASSGGGAPWNIWDSGEWWMLLAAQSMAVGTVMVRWVAKYCDPVVATGWHMVLGGLPLLAVAAWQEGPEALERLSLLTASDAALLLYVSLLGSAASYGVFFYNASRGNLTALSSLTFLTPMFAAAGGYVALGETLTPLQLTGAAVTLGAVTLISKNSGKGGGGKGGSEASGSNGGAANGSGGKAAPQWRRRHRVTTGRWPPRLWQRCLAPPAAPRRRAVAAAAGGVAAQRQAAEPLSQQSAQPPADRQELSPLEQLLKNVNVRQTRIAQEAWGQVLRRGDTVVDATAGRGHDAAFLAKAVGPAGTVHAFDVQEEALRATAAAVEAAVAPGEAPQLHLHHTSHAHMKEVVAGPARLVVFNLGYLPGGDETTTTQASSTIPAVEAAGELLAPGGLISILCYTGHAGGTGEYLAVRQFVTDLPPSLWVSSELRLLNRPTAPVLLLLWKRDV